MERIKQVLVILLLMLSVSAALLVNVLLLRADRVLTETHTTIEETRALIAQERVDLHNVVEDQRRHWVQLTENGNKATENLRRVLVHIDRRVLPKLEANLDESARLMRTTNRTVQTLSTDLHGIARESQRASREAADLLADPDIKAAIREASEALQGVNKTVAQAGPPIVASSQHIESTTKNIDKQVERWTKPAHWTVRTIGTILSLGSKAGSWVGGFFK